MAELRRVPWMLNQPGACYPAEYLRAQHHDATSGGTGVSTPEALKVEAQEAPDGSVRIAPGGGTAKSTYPGQENQSYQATNFQPYRFEIEPTGSASKGRHDLLIQRFIDPEHEDVPGYDGEYPIPKSTAQEMDFWWFEVYQGRSSKTEFDFPHVKLAHIRREPNKTIIEPSDITDLRRLAAPKTWLHMKARNLNIAETQSLHTGSKVWPTPQTHTVTFPQWATRLHVNATVGMARSHATAGDRGVASGNFLVFFIHPDGTEINTQQTDWRTAGDQDRERFNIVLAHTLKIPKKFRGEDITVEYRARKYGGPNVYADGATSYLTQVYFEQDVV